MLSGYSINFDAATFTKDWQKILFAVNHLQKDKNFYRNLLKTIYFRCDSEHLQRIRDISCLFNLRVFSEGIQI